MGNPVIKVSAGNHCRRFCNVYLKGKINDLPGIDFTKSILLKGSESQTWAQCEVNGEDFLLSWIITSLDAGKTEEYQIIPSDEPAIEGVVLEEGTNEIRVSIGGEYFTSYNYSSEYPKPYLGPIIGPYGDYITRLDPTAEEHPHHRSLWISHGSVNGVDTWNEREGSHGREIHQEFTQVLSGPVYGRISAKNHWTDFHGNGLLNETREIIIYNMPCDARIVDVATTLEATEGPVILGPTKEAGPLGVRVASSMTVPNGGCIVNSYGGINERETWGKRAHWCDYSGDVEGKRVGISVYDHPDNMQHPTYWHVRNYGLLAPNIWYFTGEHTMNPGDIIKFKYRVYFHAGDVVYADVAGKYHDYINLPEAQIISE